MTFLLFESRFAFYESAKRKDSIWEMRKKSSPNHNNGLVDLG